MIMLSTRCHFVEDGPRPPVPGKEDINIFTSHLLWPENYEPMSKGSSDHACMRWVESLDTLLDDQEGITLFRSFLGREGSADVIDFWLACRGFWLAYCSPLSCSYTPSSTSFNKRRRKLAKAIYRKYISGGIVGKLIKTATKMFIHDRICRRQLDSTLFIQAKEEAQEMLKDAYQLFLKSDFLLTPSSFSDSIGQEVINSKQEEAGSSRHELKDHNQKAGNSNNELKSPTQTRMDDQQEAAECLPVLINRESETDLTTSNQEQLIEIDFTHTTTKKKADQSSYKQHRNMQRIHHVMKNIRVDPQTFAAELISRLELVRRKNQRQEEKTKAKDVPMFSHYDNVDGRLFGDRGHHSGDGALAESSNGEAEGYSWNRKCVFKRMTVAYFFCGETIPYQTSVKGDVVTLRHFKDLLTKKGEYRFFFQKASEEFECGSVYEEVHEDDAILPVYESRIIGKVERMD